MIQLKAKWSALILVMLILSFSMPLLHSVAQERQGADRFRFRSDFGKRFNDSNALYSGVSVGNISALFVAPQGNTTFSAMFILHQRSEVAKAKFKNETETRPIFVDQKMIMEFPKLILVGNALGNRPTVVPLHELHWNLTVEKTRIDSSRGKLDIRLVSSLQQPDPLKGVKIEIIVHMAVFKEQTTEIVRSIQYGQDGYEIIEQETVGERIGFSLKMDHRITGLPNSNYRHVVLPVHIRYLQSMVAPKGIDSSGFRPKQILVESRTDNETKHPSIRLKSGTFLGMVYNWTEEVIVDDQHTKVMVQPLKRESRGPVFEQGNTRIRIRQGFESSIALIYPYGNNILHDPALEITSFLPYSRVFTISSSAQVWGQVFALLVLIPILFIIGKRKT